MSDRLLGYIGDLPLMRVLRALSSSPRYLRELVEVCSLSPGGVSDIIRRLAELGVLCESSEGNRKRYQLVVSESEEKALQELFGCYQNQKLQERAERFSQSAKEKLEWMDETFSFFKDVKAGINDTAKSS